MMALFDPIAVNLPAMVLDLFAVSLALILIWSIPLHLRYLRAQPERIYGPPMRILARIRLPQLTVRQAMAAQAVMIVSLIAAAGLEGASARLAVFTALLVYFPAFAHLADFETTRRKTYLLPLILLILALSPGIGGGWDDPAPYWPMWLIKCVICHVYVSGAVQKLRRSGLSWTQGAQLQAYLATIYMWEDAPRAKALLERPRLCAVMSAAVLLVQSTFWVMLVVPQTTIVYFALGAAFHIGTALTMNIYYLKYMSVSYLILALDVAYHLGAFGLA